MPKRDAFWSRLDELVATCDVKIDRPKGTAHPRYPSLIYPLDYGYLVNTGSSDGNEIDVWVGSLPERTVTGIVCTVDMVKKDAEFKILVGCTREQADEIRHTHEGGPMSAILLLRSEVQGS
jgi:inorganic pyrophosphatase